MPHKPTAPRLLLITLLLFSFIFGTGGRTSFCFMPDGAVHLEESHFSCGLDADHSPAHQQAELCRGDQGGEQCWDIMLGVDASGQQQRCPAQLTTPVMQPLGPSIVAAPAERMPFPPLPAVRSSQLHFLQSVILLI